MVTLLAIAVPTLAILLAVIDHRMQIGLVRADIVRLRKDVDAGRAQFRKDTNADLAVLRKDLTSDGNYLRKLMVGDMAEVRDGVRGDLERLEERLAVGKGKE